VTSGSSTLTQETLAQRPKRADARRNYEKLIAAAREAFTEADRSASLEDIARRAGVGIGTLYRHFPTRADLLEAVYVEEVDALSRSAADLSDRPPWDALVGWLRRFIGYIATKQALVEELFAIPDRDRQVFKTCRTALYDAGEPLLTRAQASGEVRPDVTIADVVQIVGGIAKIPADDPAEVERLLSIALDGLRFRPASSSRTPARRRTEAHVASDPPGASRDLR
jgi:AcrR family transcriptional regulator